MSGQGLDFIHEVLQSKGIPIILDSGDIRFVSRNLKERLFGLSRTIKEQVADAVLKHYQVILKAVSALYYDEDDSKRALALRFQKKLKAMLPKDKQVACDFIQALTTEWMSALPKDMKAQSLDALLLPGTHDTGAYTLSAVSPSDVTGVIQKAFYRVASWPGVRDLVQAVTLTQRNDIRTQLDKGVRLFDFRLALGKDNRFYLAHTFLCCDLEAALTDIASFLEAHSQEIVVLNVKPDWPHRAVFHDPKNRKQVVDLFDAKLQDKICKPPQGQNPPKLPSINAMLAKNHRVILCGDELGLWPDSHWQMHEVWPDTQQERSVLPTMQEKLKQSKADVYSAMYIGLETTPDTKTILLMLAQHPFTGQSLLQAGQQIQQDELKPALQDIETFNRAKRSEQARVSAMMFDGLLKSTVQTIVNLNQPAKDSLSSQCQVRPG